jgi:hypothetical protein
VLAPLVVSRLCLWLSCPHYWEYLQLVGGQLQRGVLARTGEVPNLQGGPGVALRDGGVGLPVGTNIFLFDASCIQVHREPYWSIWMVGTSWKRRHRFSTMKFFPFVCGLPTWQLWSQHAVIMLQDGQLGGHLIIFLTKSICQAAIIFLTQGME